MMDQEEAARIRALGEIAAEFDLDAIRVKTGDTEIEIVRRDPAAYAAPVVYAGPAAAAAPAAIAGGESTNGPVASPNTRKITAPVVGVFYRAGAPGQDPFVEVGSRVKLGETLCILEAMKLMNEINSDFAGTITRIIPENGELVTNGQDLFWIEV